MKESDYTTSDVTIDINVNKSDVLSDYDSGYTIAEDLCEIDEIIDKLLPDDYQQSKQTNISSRVDHINQTFAQFDRIMKLVSNYSTNLSPIFQKLMARFSTIIYEISLEPLCMASLVTIAEAINNRHLWALKFIDSMGGIPSGILEGVLSSIGEYNECLDIKSPANSQIAITGQYCLAKPIIPHPKRHTYKSGEPFNNLFSLPDQFVDEVIDALYLVNGSLINIGICIPSTCKPSDVENAINQIFFPLIQMPIQIGPICSIKDAPLILDNYQLMALSIFLTLLLITILAAIYEYYISSSLLPTNNVDNNTLKISKISQLIISFSIISNTKAMFKKSTKKFVNIDFIRFVMLLQTILMHQYYVYMFWSAIPLTKRLMTGMTSKVGTDYKYAFLRNVHNTDFFFALSGLLTAYSMIGALERSKGKFNYIKYIINIYLRFYPSIFGVILMYYILPLLGSGPFWHRADTQYVESCRNHLLSNLLSFNYYILDLDEFVQSSMVCCIIF
ncbi:uncharacterized protein LOC128961509 [Oppia nitens]|uniref:uncharacterized protein LOC128961509 n=1 Tax=Oppia nitens TaxID=1686743 RepID=UPI0023DC311F|nr:uncharacterized protein LOC128961509 [Oppia nitens]